MHPSGSAVIFDLDGTLVDTALDLHRTLNHVLDAFGRPPVALAEVRQMVGDGARMLVRRGFSASGDLPDDTRLEEAVALFFEYYGDHLADHSRPFPGLTDQLERFRAADVCLGVCTNKPQELSARLLEQLGLSWFFQAVVGGDSLPVRKPDGGHITGTLERLGCNGVLAVMVGDSINEVLAARNAGIPVVAVSFGYTKVPAHDLGADAMIEHLEELPGALETVLPTAKF